MVDRVRVVHPEGGEKMVKDSLAADTDINNIIARHVAHGIPLPLNGKQAVYGDFSDSLDFHEALNRVRAAEAEFGMLPAHVRAYCQNDPGMFLDLVLDPERKDELIKLGMLESQVPEMIADTRSETPVEGGN